MAHTRPSGLPVVEDEKAIVTEEVSHVDGRGRLNFLPRWRGRVSWLSSRPTGAIESLMVFEEPGLISIRDWASDGLAIQKRYEELANSTEDDALEVLRLIQSRYCRLIILEKERTSIGDAALAHLGISFERGNKSIVYVSTFPDLIVLLSPALRNARLLAGDPRMDDLP